MYSHSDPFPIALASRGMQNKLFLQFSSILAEARSKNDTFAILSYFRFNVEINRRIYSTDERYLLGFKIAHGYFDIAILRSHKSQEQTPVVIFSRGEIGINRMGASHMCDAFGVARQ